MEIMEVTNDWDGVGIMPKNEQVDGENKQFYENGKIKHIRWSQNGKRHRIDGPADIFYDRNGIVRREEWFQFGGKHRLDGPAVIHCNGNGNKELEIWYQEGRIHRVAGPAKINYFTNSYLAKEEWFQDGQRHRDDGPAIVEYYEDGGIKIKSYYVYDIHAVPASWNCPSYVEYYDNGAVAKEEWTQQMLSNRPFRGYDADDNLIGVRHRENQPAIIKYDSDGTTAREEWYNMDLLQRADGPAIVEYDSNDEVIYERWMWQGRAHREDGPAVFNLRLGVSGFKRPNKAFRGYYLNGIKVAKWFVMTPAKDLDPSNIHKFKSVEHRREFIKKIGVDRIINEIGNIIETDGDYQLLEIKVNSRGIASPYLKMTNPSTGDIHIEGVHPECETIQQALNWRNGRSDQPAIIT